MRTPAKIAAALVIIAAGVGAWTHQPLLQSLPSQWAAMHWPWAMPAAPAQGGRNGRDGPVPVSLATAKTADVPIYVTGIGTVKALNTVTVRPQIDGKVTDITFTEGAEVKKGELLARLDPITVKAQLDQVLAKKALDESQLANSIRDLDREIKVGTLGVTQQVIDTQKALVAQQKAQIQSDEAVVTSARALLAYADVRSPITGITGIRQVDIGNIMRSQTDPIVVIAQVQPISIIFTLPQQQLSDVSAGMAAGQLQAEALTTDGGKVLDTGKLQVIDNQVDPTTGTVKFKAEFPNAAKQLWPGQFVSVRLKINTLKQVVVVPTVAVQQGPTGSFVYLAEDDDTVSVHPVTVGSNDAERTVIASGIADGDDVVINGFSRLKDGARFRTPATKGNNKPAAAPAGKSAPAPSAGANGAANANPTAAADAGSGSTVKTQ